METAQETCGAPPVRTDQKTLYIRPDQELKTLKRSRNQTLRKIKRCLDPQELECLRKELAKAKEDVRKYVAGKRVECFRKLCEKIAKANVNEIFKITRNVKKLRIHKMPTLHTEQTEQYAEHFRRLYRSSHQEIPQERTMEPTIRIEEIEEIFEEGKVARIISRMPTAKAPGISGITNEMIKYSGYNVRKSITILFRILFLLKCVPEEWKHALIFPIHKKGNAQEIGNYRPISLTEVPRKLFEACIQEYLQEKELPLSKYQGGFRAKRSTLGQLATIQEAILETRRKRQPVHMAFLDITAAYDTVDRGILWNRCEKAKIDVHTIAVLKELFDRNSSRLIVNDTLSKGIELQRGLLQGSVLSPTLYSIFIDPLASKINETSTDGMTLNNENLKILLYADDIVLLTTKAHHLAKMLKVCEQMAKEDAYQFNPKKCAIVSSRELRYKFKIHNQVIPQEDEFVYLGIPVNKNGIDTRRQTKRIEDKSRKLVQVLKEAGCHGRGWDIQTRARVFRSLISPIFEYALAIMPRCKRFTNELRRHQGRMLAEITSVSTHGTSLEALTLLYGAPDIDTRMSILKYRWVTRTSKLNDEGFMAYCAFKHYKKLGEMARLRIMSPFHQTQEAEEIRAMEAELMENTANTEKVISRRWAEKRRNEIYTRILPTYATLTPKINLWIGHIHRRDQATARKVVYWLLKKWPSRPRSCRICLENGRQDHFIKHVTEQWSSERPMMAKSSLDDFIRISSMRKEKITDEEIHRIGRTLEEISNMWI